MTLPELVARRRQEGEIWTSLNLGTHWAQMAADGRI
jgi:hypothetical protein